MEWLAAAGHELYAWSLGLALVAVFWDAGPGYSRDHPPLARRVAGVAAGVLALLGLGCLALDTPPLTLLMVVAPFTVLSAWYAWLWWAGRPPASRRARGVEAAVVGGICLLLLMLTAGPRGWHGGVVMGAYGASAGLLGGLTALVILGLPDRGRVAGMGDDTQPDSVPWQALAVGAGLMVLVALEQGWALAGLDAGAVPPMGRWLLLSLILPLALVAAGRKLAPRVGQVCRGAALASALTGQAVIHLLLLQAP